MRVIIQRVTHAAVRVEGAVVGEIGPGLLLLVGVGQDDTMDSIPPLVDKIVKMRIFSNADGKFDKDVTQIDGEILAVSQFTLYADTSRGRRPEFIQAMKPEPARALFDAFVSALKTSGVRNVATGVFGAMMEVSLVNDGPVTITVER
jgi:D-tyrosyl-tRNA(Tyr) deacylase